MLRAQVQLAWKTQAGHRHHVEGLDNEDAVFVTEDHPVFDALLMVADGMGGHPLPGEASQTAVASARQVLSDPERLGRLSDVNSALLAALQAAHAAVRRLRSGPGKPPGTTLSLAVVVDGSLHVAHIGDGTVFLMRKGQVHPVAGGEERRTGNRPTQFLGQDGPLEPEVRQAPLAEGDRLLLCTDGLTRYFREAGPEALERVLGRQGVEVQAIASQLIAHSRPGDYDDDTTVAVAEVGPLTRLARRPAAVVTSALAEEPPAGGKMEEPMRRSTSGRGSALWPALAGALAGGVLLAGGFLAGRMTAPAALGGSGHPAAPAADRFVAPEELAHLPPGNVILLDPLGGRTYSLATRNGAPPQETLRLQGFAVGRNKRLTSAGAFTLDPAKGLLTDADGRSYPVEVDAARGSLRVVRSGTLVVRTEPAGARVLVDGRAVGVAPRTLTLPGGGHEVRVEGSAWTSTSQVEVVPGRSVTITLGPGESGP